MLTSKSMQLNGEYIETLIEGYTTIDVSKNELLGVDQETEEIGISDGSVFKYKRYEERSIEISFAIEGKTRIDLNEKLTKLNGVLNVTNAQLIFADEPDVYYTGTLDGSPSAAIAIGGATDNAVATGKFTFLCSDPFKYSIIEHEASQSEDDSNVIFVNYEGTYKSYPKLEVDFLKQEDTGTALSNNGDCGYVAFFNEDKKIIQIGDPEEVDGQETGIYEKSQTLINQTFTESNSWSTSGSTWSKNTGTLCLEDVVRAGEVGMSISTYTTKVNSKTTSAKVLAKTRSDKGSPYIYYTVSLSASASSRNADSIRVTAVVTSSLWTSSSWFLGGYVLLGSLYIGGKWHNVTLKASSAKWKGTTAHTASMSFTVSGLSDTQTSITGIKFKVSRTDSLGDGAGVLNERSCGSLTISSYTESVADAYCLSPTSYGTSTNNFHGPSISRALPIDSKGASGATDFTFSYKHKMSTGNSATSSEEIGGFQAVLIAGTSVFGGVRVVKNQNGTGGKLNYYVNGKIAYTKDVDLTYKNATLGEGANVVVTKSGSDISFAIGNDTQKFTDTSIKTITITEIAFIFEQYSASPSLTYNGLSWVKFVKDNCDTWENIPNKFGSNDILICDCRKGEILLNDVSTPKLGAIGNNWESFYLKPGINQIGISYSDWVESANAPTFKIKYREVFI